MKEECYLLDSPLCQSVSFNLKNGLFHLKSDRCLSLFLELFLYVFITQVISLFPFLYASNNGPHRFYLDTAMDITRGVNGQMCFTFHGHSILPQKALLAKVKEVFDRQRMWYFLFVEIQYKLVSETQALLFK